MKNISAIAAIVWILDLLRPSCIKDIFFFFSPFQLFKALKPQGIGCTFDNLSLLFFNWV